MTGSKGIFIDIVVLRKESNLTVTLKDNSKQVALFQADIVSGCEDSGTPNGRYKTGKWIKDKINPVYGRTPWSQYPWGNPYGPYFLPLYDAKTNKYTTYGIHGTRGPLLGNFSKPPIPQSLLSLFVEKNHARYLYCSHGCIRLSNRNITKLFELLTRPSYAGASVAVTVE